MSRKPILILAAAGLSLGFFGTPVQAAEPPRHCVVNVADDKARTKCFGSFRTAIANATGGQVTDAPADPQTAMNDSGFAARLNALRPRAASGSVAPAASVVLSIEWQDGDFEDSSLTFTAPSGCSITLNDVDWQVASLPPGSDDEISSYRAFSGCLVKHFEHANFGGASIGFDGDRVDMGELDDKTSSIQWS